MSEAVINRKNAQWTCRHTSLLAANTHIDALAWERKAIGFPKKYGPLELCAEIFPSRTKVSILRDAAFPIFQARNSIYDNCW
jgi:hypothetical protein